MEKNDFGQTPLMLALKSQEKAEVVHQLIKAGAYIHAQDENGNTALHYAARFSSNSNIIHLLIENGAAINSQRDVETPSPLITALEVNNTYSMIKELINAGADVNSDFIVDVFSESKWTPLMVACAHCSDPEIITLLIDSGAKIDVIDEDGNTPFSLAQKNPELQDCAIIKRLKALTPSNEQIRIIRTIKEAFKRSVIERLSSARANSVLIASKSENKIREKIRSFAHEYGYPYIEVSSDLFKNTPTNTIEKLKQLKDTYKVLYISTQSADDLNKHLCPFDSLFLDASFGINTNASDTTFTNDPIIIVHVPLQTFDIDGLDHHMKDRFWRIVTE